MIPPLYSIFFGLFLCVIDERQIDDIDESCAEFLVSVHHQLTSHVVGIYSSHFLTEVISQNGQLHHVEIIGKYAALFAYSMTESPALGGEAKKMSEKQQEF